ncbi:MAG TPA: hypothetical protein VLF43_05125 [Candidatus Saccharimonadales bacterium]|nr:hypothetical protein [Candidatus Saccharimonadales bacterium]
MNKNKSPAESKPKQLFTKRRLVAAGAVLVAAAGGVSALTDRSSPQPAPVIQETEIPNGPTLKSVETAPNPSGPEAILATGIRCEGMEVNDISDELTPQERTSQQLLRVNLKLGNQSDALAQRADMQANGISAVLEPTARTIVLADDNPEAWLSRSTGEVPTEAMTLVDTIQGGSVVDESASLLLHAANARPGTTAVVAIEQTVSSVGTDGAPHHLTGLVPCGVLQSDGRSSWQQVAPNPDFMLPLVFDMNNIASAVPVQR